MKKAISISGATILVLIILSSFAEMKTGINFSTRINREICTLVNNNEKDPNKSPESVMNTIFQAAITGEVGKLKFLLPPVENKTGQMPCDGDCKALCNPGNESMKGELKGNYISLQDFKKYFSKAKIVGKPTIDGNRASVNFVFGPDLEKNETMNMQNINGKWYLMSF